MKRILICVLWAVAPLSFCAWGGEAESTAVIKPAIKTYYEAAMPKDPLASAFFSATFPGLGQIYNKEYLRGVATGVAFWASFFGAQYLLYQWEKINTDTFYVEDYFSPDPNNPIIHPVTTLKPDNKQVGLPTGEKVLLVSAVVIGLGSYVFGIYDSYTGAKRYNRKLVASSGIRPELYCMLGVRRNEAGLRLNF